MTLFVLAFFPYENSSHMTSYFLLAPKRIHALVWGQTTCYQCGIVLTILKRLTKLPHSLTLSALRSHVATIQPDEVTFRTEKWIRSNLAGALRRTHPHVDAHLLEIYQETSGKKSPPPPDISNLRHSGNFQNTTRKYVSGEDAGDTLKRIELRTVGEVVSRRHRRSLIRAVKLLHSPQQAGSGCNRTNCKLPHET